MALPSGTRMGPYELLAPLGAGGMGEVYRAHDPKLKREVAIKVLPEAFAQDPERMKRFEREARVLASLNHPNIAAIYGFEEVDGIRALVLELVEGPTLAERIASGPVPLDEAIRIATQIAHGLEAAHEKAIVHRDLKPANVKLTKDGDVKILDFGLAKALETESTVVDDTHSPTLTRAATLAGVLLGTAAYMSPEQAKGKPADRRADVWAFGVVLYEMLTARRAFSGEDVSETLASVLTRDPDLSALPADLPARLRSLLARCLTKDPKKRLQAIGEARIALEDPGETGSQEGRLAMMALAGVAGLGLGLSLWMLWPRPHAPAARPLRVSVELGTDARLNIDSFVGYGAAATLSPDGALLVFSAREAAASQPRLYLRRLDELKASPLSGTDGASNPFFSPDGKWLAFFTATKLMKVPVTGGAAVALADVNQNRGGSWGEDGFIVFAPTDRSPLFRVEASGGASEAITTLDPAAREVTHRWPHVLPGGKGVLYTAHAVVGNYEDASVVAQAFPSGSKRVLQKGGFYCRYLRSGHLLYVHQGTLYGGRFDPETLQMTGPPVPVLEGVVSSRTTAGAQFALSDEGTLLYVPGDVSGGDVVLLWLEREGRTSPLRTVPGDYRNLRFSPDGRRLAFDVTSGSQRDVWIYEWDRDTLTRLTFTPGEDSVPVWSPDGRQVAYASAPDGKGAPNLFRQRSDGTGQGERLTESENIQLPTSWHPSGRFLAFYENNRKTAWDVVVVEVPGEAASGSRRQAPIAFANSPASEREPAFSPDGQWLAYVSNESGSYEVYVQPFPATGGKWQVSAGGGNLPTWSRTGRELLYLAEDQRIMVVAFTADAKSLHLDRPRPWSEQRLEERISSRNFDLHPDGRRVAALIAPQGKAEIKRDHVTLIFNFRAQLEQIASATSR